MADVLLEMHFDLQAKVYKGQRTDRSLGLPNSISEGLCADLARKWQEKYDPEKSDTASSPRLSTLPPPSSRTKTWSCFSCICDTTRVGDDYDDRTRGLINYARRKYAEELRLYNIGITLRTYCRGDFRGEDATSWVAHPPSIVLTRLPACEGRWRTSAMIPIFTPQYISYMWNTGHGYYVQGSAGERAASEMTEFGPPTIPARRPQQYRGTRSDDPNDGGGEDGNGEPSSGGTDNSETRGFQWPPSPLLLPPPQNRPESMRFPASDETPRTASGSVPNNGLADSMIRRQSDISEIEPDTPSPPMTPMSMGGAVIVPGKGESGRGANSHGTSGGHMSSHSRSLRNPHSPLARLPASSPTASRISLLNPLRAAVRSAVNAPPPPGGQGGEQSGMPLEHGRGDTVRATRLPDEPTGSEKGRRAMGTEMRGDASSASASIEQRSSETHP